jgi:hypothetical protein
LCRKSVIRHTHVAIFVHRVEDDHREKFPIFARPEIPDVGLIAVFEGACQQGQFVPAFSL